MALPKLISVIITTYNHAHYLPKAIESVLQQDYESKELIVVDDGSTDNTQEVVRRYPQVQYILQQNAGLSAARNTGVNHANGQYVIFLDADDWFLEGAFTKGIEALTNNPSAAFSYGLHIKFYGEGVEVLSHEVLELKENHYHNLLHYNFIAMHSAVVYRSWVFDSFRFDPDLKACEDYDLYLKITRQHPVVYHSHVMAAYRKVSGSMSSNVSLMVVTGLKVMQRQIPLLQNKEEKQWSEKGLPFWKEYYGIELYETMRRTGFFPFDGKKLKELTTLFSCNKRLFFNYFLGKIL